jgi:hypothetical protein
MVINLLIFKFNEIKDRFEGKRNAAVKTAALN